MYSSASKACDAFYLCRDVESAISKQPTYPQDTISDRMNFSYNLSDLGPVLVLHP